MMEVPMKLLNIIFSKSRMGIAGHRQGHRLLGFQRFKLHVILGKCVSCSAVVQKPMGK